MENKYTHRYIARIVLEAETPLFVGSGESSLLKDALVQRDMHGFPMIQGTSLTGVLRHSLMDKFGENNKEKDKTEEEKKWDSFFGFQATSGKKGLGSQVKISSAYLILENNKIAEGVKPEFDIEKYKKYFNDLPVRQHVRITHKGVAKEHGLFDNEVVYKGVRFIFEVELKGNAEDEKLWNEFLNKLASPLFRVGQGTRNGYGKLSVVSCKAKTFDLQKQEDFEAYLNYDPSLNAKNEVLNEHEVSNDEKLIRYQLKLKPESFFIFSAGYGDDEVYNIPVKEKIISYDKNGTMQEPKELTLIPASSVKGALRHRTAFHFNRLMKFYVDKINKNVIEYLETNNQAVYELFGAEEGVKDDRTEKTDGERKGRRGKIIMNDILLNKVKNNKIFNHVAIDRFTGGAMDGALFSEKVSYFEDENKEICFDIYLEDTNLSDNIIKEAFEETLKDLCKGLLPLGGMTTKGHGIFTGKLLINDKEEFNYEN
jgi:CRISPR/Cas system CSM-associated protein Csm3 (group 7 of RAMP superfamily)